MTNYQLRELASESDLKGVRFKTEKFGFLSKMPIEQTKNLRTELTEIWPTKNLKVLNQLTDIEQLTDKLNFLENFVATSFKQNIKSEYQIILTVAKKIRTILGIVNVGDLAKLHHLSLKRSFKIIAVSVLNLNRFFMFRTVFKLNGSSHKTRYYSYTRPLCIRNSIVILNHIMINQCEVISIFTRAMLCCKKENTWFY